MAFSVVFLAGCADKLQTDNLSWSGHSPKNVIIMIADGGGFNHFRAADYYECSETPCQSCENFPVRLAMSTYPYGGKYDPNAASRSFNYVKNNPTDSAAAATAMATGVKSYNAAIGVDVNGSPVLNLLERAEQLGKSTGVVTSVPFSHATPAGFVVHNSSRDSYTQIADDMVNKSAAEVIMGAGHPFYDADGNSAKASNYKYIAAGAWAGLKGGTAGGDSDGDGVPDAWTLIQSRCEFQAFASGKTPKRIFGLAQVYETLQEKRSGNPGAAPYQAPLTQTVPTLEEMTRAALNVLDDDPNGLFLMVEGGAVDWAAHSNLSGRLIEEMNEFNRSVNAVINWVNHKSNWNDTLLIVTADHETGYLTGPGYNEIINNGPGKLPAMEWHSKNHTNSLVPFFAKGNGARQFTKTIKGLDPVYGPYIDNTDIANAIFSLW
jgi:alkaline phosphatase